MAVKFTDLPEEIQAAIKSVVNYATDNAEAEDYIENYPNCKGLHVFEGGNTLINWMELTSYSPEDRAGLKPEDYDSDSDEP